MADNREAPIVLFLCTANSCRSQMAEALARARWGPQLRAFSAGVRPGAAVDPLALAVLSEIGIAHDGAFPKDMTTAEALFGGARCALVVTVCDSAATECPSYGNAARQHHEGFRDPPALVRGANAAADPLPYYREVRDEIAAFVETLPRWIPSLVRGEAAAAAPAEAHSSLKVNVGSRTDLFVPEDGSPSLLSTGSEASPVISPSLPPPRIGFFEKYLSVWVLLCIIAGAVIGYFAPGVADALGTAQFAQINAIVAVLLWIMIFPMLIQIDFLSLYRIKDNPAAIGLTTVINYLVKPFTMYALAILFFRVFYTSVIPDAALRDNYIAGLVLLAGAPCTAMVFVWSSLAGGDAAYTLVQVAFNDVLMLGLYVPIVALLIGVSNISLPWLTIIVAVVLFIAAPLALAVTARALIVAKYGAAAIDRVVHAAKPVTIVALLATLVLIFIFQGQTIGRKPLDIVLIAVPIVIQCVLNFSICYSIGYATCIPHERLAPASMIATSNFFELAVAVAISVYGLQSGAALATVVGVLVEVPVMLGLVWVSNALRPWLERRGAACAQVCPWSIAAAERCGTATQCCRSSAAAAAPTPQSSSPGSVLEPTA